MSDIITIQARDSASTAQIAPEAGFNLFSFEAASEGHRIDVIDADPRFPADDLRPSGHGIPLLFPYPNRIRGGSFSWEGRSWQLPPERVQYDRTGNAIHGFCLDRPWRVIERGPDFVTAEFQLSRDASDRRDLWPADFLLEATYRIRGSVLRFELRIENPDSVPLPWGFGTHPYFRLPLDSESQVGSCLLQVPVSEQWELQDCLPTGRKHAVPADWELPDGAYLDVLKLDDVFTGLTVDADRMVTTLIMDERAGMQVTQRFSDEFEHVVLYTPPGRNAVCIEPYTCITDAVNLSIEETGWRVLSPETSHVLQIEITVSPVLA